MRWRLALKSGSTIQVAPAAEIQQECEKSLRKLQTDRIDLYYAHRDDTATPLEETMEAFDRLIKTGKVRAIGASNLRVWRIAEANIVRQFRGWSQYCAVEQRHTYLHPRHGADFGPQICINDDLKDYSRSHNISLIGYSILLQGAYTREDRKVPAQYAGYEADERLKTLKAVAQEVGATVNQVIIAWMLQSNPPVVPIVGGSRPEQLSENLAALGITLAADQMTRLDMAGSPEIKQAWLR
jgi:aryl-alcohol dehydrogenase-like predicted oxidoreductase